MGCRAGRRAGAEGEPCLTDSCPQSPRQPDLGLCGLLKPWCLCWSLGLFPSKLACGAGRLLRKCEPGGSFDLVTSGESCSSLLPLTHPSNGVFSSLAAPVPKSQEGQGPGPVSRAGGCCRGCSVSPPPCSHPQPRVDKLLSAPVDPSAALQWAAARSQPPPARSPQHLHSLLGSGGVCAWVGVLLRRSWKARALGSPSTLPGPACPCHQA